MKHIKIEKTDTGYVLYHSKFFQGMMSLLFLLMLSVAALPWVAFAISGMPDETGELWLAIVCSVGLGGIGGYFFCVSLGQRVVVDNNGVRLYRFGRCKREMPWKYVKSWGITSVLMRPRYHHKEQYYLYFSAKAGERSGKNCIVVAIHPDEKQMLRRAELNDFVEAHRPFAGED